ncbi:hypothetical protein E4U55_006309 [Claviceps digitariae]|nr:hypothetical protein E4U55_006309 [Claviceps digitariae]
MSTTSSLLQQHIKATTTSHESESVKNHHALGCSSDAPAPAPPSSPTRRSGKRPAPRGAAFYPRKRANTACQVCRARKTKCDNEKPSCSYCVSVGATCVQSAVDLSSFDPASLKILDRLDSLERLLRTTISADVDAPARHVSVSVSDAAAPPASLPCAPASASDSHRDRDRERHQLRRLSTYRIYGSQDNEHDEVDADLDLNLDLDLHSVLPTRVNRIFEWHVFRSNKTFAPPKNTTLPADAVSLPAGSASLAALVDMDSHRIYRLLDNFFLYIHCKNPILDEPSARRLVRRVFLDGIDWSPASCLALIICALGSIATPFGPSPETRIGSQAYADSQVFFQAAQKRIGLLLIRSDIVGAQCLFLSGIYMMMVFQPIYAWRFFSQALAACQHLPFLARAQDVVSTQDMLAQDTSTPDDVSNAAASVERMSRRDTQEQAVYWSSWKSERELRTELSLPDFDDIDHSGTTLYPPFFPAPPAPAPASPDDDGGPGSEAQRSKASWLFYLAEISLRRLTSRLCREVMSLRRRYASNTTFLDVLADMTPEYEAQAQQWSDNLPGELSVRSAIDDDGIARSVLRGKLINLYEMLYWPFVMASLGCCGRARCAYYSHHPRRDRTAPTTVLKAQFVELARRGLDTHMHQIRANEPGFFHRHHGGFFMIRACSRSALTLVAAAKSDMSMPGGWREAVYKVINMLGYWEEEDGDVAGWRARLEMEMAMTREP